MRAVRIDVIAEVVPVLVLMLAHNGRPRPRPRPLPTSIRPRTQRRTLVIDIAVAH